MPRARRRMTLWNGDAKSSRRAGRFRVNQPVQQKVSRPAGEKSRAFKARYAGECPACYGSWIEGDLIRRCGGFYYHDECVK
jgi:hypothetical protein